MISDTIRLISNNVDAMLAYFLFGYILDFYLFLFKKVVSMRSYDAICLQHDCALQREVKLKLK